MNLYYTLGYRLVRKMLICNRDGNKPTSREFDSPNTENSKSEARNPLPREISPNLSFKIPANVENNFRSMAIEDSFISQGSPREIGDKL